MESFVLIGAAGPLSDEGYSMLYNNLVSLNSVVYSFVVKVPFSQGCFGDKKLFSITCHIGIIVTMETNPKKCFFCDIVIGQERTKTYHFCQQRRK